MPRDEDLKTLFTDSRNFEPRARETLHTLYVDFDDLPGLKDIAPDQRWRLVVDRQKIDMLEKHGIDTSNPLLCFLFDQERAYAHGLVNDWKFIAQSLAEGRELDVALIEELAGSPPCDNPISFGAHYTPAGRRALADHMEVLRRYGISSAVVIHNQVAGLYDDGAVHHGAFDPAREQASISDAPRSPPCRCQTCWRPWRKERLVPC